MMYNRKRKLHKLVQEYIYASYCYYALDHSSMLDHTFDKLCKLLLKRWDEVRQISLVILNTNYITKELLIAGTGYHIPNSICGCTLEYVLLRVRGLNI